MQAAIVNKRSGDSKHDDGEVSPRSFSAEANSHVSPSPPPRIPASPACRQSTAAAMAAAFWKAAWTQQRGGRRWSAWRHD